MSTHDLSLTLKAKLFRGLADPSRLAIVEALRFGEKTVSEIVLATRLSQSNASAHLSCLKECGLVESRQEGRNVFYSLLDPRMEDVLRASEGILAGIAERVYACTRYDSQQIEAAKEFPENSLSAIHETGDQRKQNT